MEGISHLPVLTPPFCLFQCAALASRANVSNPYIMEQENIFKFGTMC